LVQEVPLLLLAEIQVLIRCRPLAAVMEQVMMGWAGRVVLVAAAWVIFQEALAQLRKVLTAATVQALVLLALAAVAAVLDKQEQMLLLACQDQEALVVMVFPQASMAHQLLALAAAVALLETYSQALQAALAVAETAPGVLLLSLEWSILAAAAVQP
jgi:hypothetical protein